jgi:selenocysteine-specific elongation factor
MRTALNLQGLGTSDIRRGDCVATSGSLRASYLIDLEFFYLSSAEKPLKYRAPIRFHAGTAEIMGRVLMAGDEIEPGKTSYIQVQLEEPVAVLPGDHYVIRSYSPIRTIGGGRILNPLPRKRKRTKPEMWEELKLLARGEPHELVELHIRKAGLRGLTPVEISIRSGMYGKALVKLMDRLSGSKKIIRLEGEDRIIHISVFEELCLNAVRFLEDYHKDNPLVSGVSKEEFRSRIFPAALQARAATQTATQKIFNRLLTHLVKEGKIIQEQDEVRLSTHKVALGEREAEIRTAIEAVYRRAGLATPSREEALKKAAQPDEMEAAGEIFDLMVRDGALVRLKDKLFYHPSALEDIRSRVLEFFKSNEELGIDDFRKLSGGVSRKYMIPLLEYLDSQRITLRVGEKRKLRGGK